MKDAPTRSPWQFIPSLYFMQGVPNALATGVSVVLFKHLGMSTAAITFWSALITLPWALKPLWTPLIDLFRTKKEWICVMQLLMALLLFMLASVIGLSLAPSILIGLFFVMTFVSATYDAAVDGYYIDALVPEQQAFFSGIRNTFFRIGMVLGKGGLIAAAAWLASTDCAHPISFSTAWVLTFSTVGVLYIVLTVLHARVLNAIHPPEEQRLEKRSKYVDFFYSFASFFTKKNIIVFVVFVLLYRCAESQLTAMMYLFLTDNIADGGLALSGQAYGVMTIFASCAMLIGGIFGGWIITRYGLGKLLWPMAFAINLPDILYWILAYYQPDSQLLIGSFMAIEHFGYGFGFTSFMLVLLWFVEDSVHFRTSHYAICSALMVGAGSLLASISGYIKEGHNAESLSFMRSLFTGMSYCEFFVWVMICTIPGFFVTWLISRHIPPAFGKKVSKI